MLIWKKCKCNPLHFIVVCLSISISISLSHCLSGVVFFWFNSITSLTYIVSNISIVQNIYCIFDSVCPSICTYVCISWWYSWLNTQFCHRNQTLEELQCIFAFLLDQIHLFQVHKVWSNPNNMLILRNKHEQTPLFFISFGKLLNSLLINLFLNPVYV